MKVTNKTLKTVTFGRMEMMGIVDLRSLGFYKIKQEVLQEHLGKHKEMKLLCYLGILKEGISAYSRSVMLISRKMTNDKE